MEVCVLGAGAYGIALSSILFNNNVKVTMWSHNEEECNNLRSTRKSLKLKDYIIPKNVTITTDIEESIKGKQLVIISVPAFAFEETVKRIKPIIKKNQSVLIATKGIQQETCLFLSDIFEKECGNGYGIISGPTFAADIIKNVPIGFSLATKSKKVDQLIRQCFENNNTKFRSTKDIIGVEICGSIKNVMAIASGILDGMEVTDSTRALFLTESMNDIKELIDVLGGRKKTIFSFAGFGDILMTCTSKTSRNFSFGYLIGKNSSKKEIDEYLSNTTVEGLYTLKSIHKLIKKKKVKMPIIYLIHDIVIGKKEKEDLLSFLIKKI